MPFSSAGKNRMLDAWASTASGAPVTHSSLHSGIPNDSGSNEISGGSPAYARKAVAFAAASTGSVDKDATDPIFDVPGSTTVFYAGFWTASTAGVFMGYAPINGGTVEGYGTAAATGDAVTSYAHGLANDDRITTRAPIGGSLPTGLSATVLYYIVNATTDTFKVALTSGGSAIDITLDGELYFQKTIGESFGSQGTLTLDTATFAIN